MINQDCFVCQHDQALINRMGFNNHGVLGGGAKIKEEKIHVSRWR